MLVQVELDTGVCYIDVVVSGAVTNQERLDGGSGGEGRSRNQRIGVRCLGSLAIAEKYDDW